MELRQWFDLHKENAQGKVFWQMEKEISAFIAYLHNVKNTSGNTEMSYKRDLEKVLHFMAARDIQEVKDVTAQDLMDYVKYLEENKLAEIKFRSDDKVRLSLTDAGIEYGNSMDI